MKLTITDESERQQEASFFFVLRVVHLWTSTTLLSTLFSLVILFEDLGRLSTQSVDHEDAQVADEVEEEGCRSHD